MGVTQIADFLDQVTHHLIGQWPLLAIIAVLLAVLATTPGGRRWRPRWQYRRAYRANAPLTLASSRQPPPRVFDSSDQLRVVLSAPFEAKRIMSIEEYRVFREIEAEVSSWRSGYRVFSQTSLGEIIRSPDRVAHSAINSKRVDILVVAPSGLPLLAVEHQGAGHYQADAAARDAVKKEALRRAGVSYLEFFDTDAADDIRLRVRAALAARPKSAA